MRRSCIDCVEKHLGSAAVYIEETEMGYPNYRGYAIGEMQHAASECFDENPELAMAIREHRILWQKDSGHMIPFESMFAYLDIWRTVDDPPAIPKEIYAGIPKDEKGNPVMSMDTRP